MEYSKEELKELRFKLLHKKLVDMNEEEIQAVKQIVDYTIVETKIEKDMKFEYENEQCMRMVNDHHK